MDMKALEAAHQAAERMRIDVGISALSYIIGVYEEAVERQEKSIAPENMPHEELETITYDLNEAIKTACSTDDWSPVYDRIFCEEGCYAVRTREIGADLGIDFPRYLDPDASYRDDVEAWVAAFDEFKASIGDEATIGMSR